MHNTETGVHDFGCHCAGAVRNRRPREFARLAPPCLAESEARIISSKALSMAAWI